MAKFALVRYGSKGEGPSSDPEKTYTYVVNDNVRTGDNIQPVVKHRDTGKIYATTALVKNTYKESGVKGKELLNKTRSEMAGKQGIDLNKTPYDQLSTEQKNKLEITQIYSGKELGVDVPKVPQKGQKGYQTEYGQLTRGGNIAKYVQTHQTPQENIYKRSQETFEQYSQKYMGDKDNG